MTDTPHAGGGRLDDAYAFHMVDYDVPGGVRVLLIRADEATVHTRDGMVFVKDGEGKVRASTPTSRFLGFEKSPTPPHLELDLPARDGG